jgi:hypothetical protein
MSPSSKQAIIELLGDRPIAYHPMLAKALGGVVEAVFASQLLYWTGKGKIAGNWIYKTQAEMEEETGLTRSNQETARKTLIKMGILEEARRGVPGRMHYRLDLDKLADLLTMRKPHNVETPQCEMGEPDNVQCGNPAMYNAETPQCIPETTTDYAETTKQGGGQKTPPSRRPNFLPEVDEQINLLFPEGNTGIVDPSQDGDQWLTYRDGALAAYKELTGLYPDNAVGKPAIVSLAAEPGFNPQTWRTAVQSCRLAGVKPTNIGCMIDTYRAGGDYGAMKRNGKDNQHATHRRSSQNPGSDLSSDPGIAEQQRLVRAALARRPP